MSSQLGAVSVVVTPRIESLLSARLFVSPQVVGNRLYFVSNLRGHFSMYARDHGGSVPEPMIPPDIVLHNPHLVTGYLYYVFPKLGKILLMLDDHGDENYMPMFVPIDGGVPEPIFVEKFKDHRVHLVDADAKRNLAYFHADSRKEPVNRAFQADLKNGTLVRLGESKWGCFPDGRNENHSKVTVLDGYTAGDNLVYLWKKEWRERKLVYGKLLEARRPGEVVKPNGISSTHFVAGDSGLLFVNYLFEDSGGLGYLDLEDPSKIAPVSVSGVAHRGKGELNWISNTRKNRYLVGYNIDGSSWVYEATFDAPRRRMTLSRPIVGRPPLANGVLESIRYDKEGDRYALSFSTATLPTQIFTIEGTPRRLVRHTKEKVLGTPQKLLSSGEDASFTSYDGTRISSRLYLPPKELGFEGARPLEAEFLWREVKPGGDSRAVVRCERSVLARRQEFLRGPEDLLLRVADQPSRRPLDREDLRRQRGGREGEGVPVPLLVVTDRFKNAIRERWPSDNRPTQRHPTPRCVKRGLVDPRAAVDVVAHEVPVLPRIGDPIQFPLPSVGDARDRDGCDL